jgi:signal transduction histidine kinase
MPPPSRAAWSAFDRALHRGRATFGRATAGESLDHYLTTIREAVRERTAGVRSTEPALPRTAFAVRVLERLRRDFVEEVQKEDGGNSCLAIEILSALGDMECCLERAVTADEPGRRLATREALDLVVDVAHDMRSPLSAILFLVDSIRGGRSGAVTSSQAQQLALIRTAARSLEAVANDVIDYARGQDRLLEPRPVPFSVARILDAVRDVVGPSAEEKLLDFSIVGPGAEGDVRIGFPVALQRILLNLASNAVKYTQDGSVEIAARELSERRLEFSVTDSGPGIPQAVVAESFEPFRAAPGADRVSFSSSGLGLSIARRLVRTLGAELDVITFPQRGTRFMFKLDLPRGEVG